MPARVLADWVKFWELEPFGEEQYLANWRAAMQAQNVRNALRAKGRTAKLNDFMPQRKRNMTPDEIMTNLGLYMTEDYGT